MSANFPKPKFIEGGCLCGSVRYRVDFAENHDFVKASGSCQCTQDRKQTGSYFFPSHRVEPASSFSITGPNTALKQYSASPGAQRGFCGNCGSFLYWKREGADRISIAVGSVDALYLIGEGAGEGNDVPPGGYGAALAGGGGDHEWVANEIKGVTDNMPLFQKGKRWDGDEP